MPDSYYVHYSPAWDRFYNSRFRSRAPKVYYVADHDRGVLRKIGEYKTNQAKWAKQ